MSANPYIIEHSQTYTDFGLQQSKLWPPNTLCVTIAGANTAKTAILKFPACFPDSIVGFIPDPQMADLHFVKYSLDLMRDRFLVVTRGATQDNLSLDKLLSFPLPTPSLEIQQHIGGILSAYDDLIENCGRRIRVLDEMTRALYREWFVNFRYPGYEKVPIVDSAIGRIPKGWRAATLKDMARINAEQIDTKHPPSRIRYIDISSVSPGTVDNVSDIAFADAPGRARRVVRHGDVLWSCVRPNRRSHALILNPEDATIASTGFAVLTPAGVPFTYLYAATTTDAFVDHLEKRATGAAYPAVTAKVFEDAPALLPAPSIAETFGQTASPLAETVAVLHRRTENLRKARDLILPRLLAGQLSVDVESAA